MAVASFSRIMPHCLTAKTVQEWFEEHDQEFKVLPWPPNPPHLNLIKHSWDVLEKQGVERQTETPSIYVRYIQL